MWIIALKSCFNCSCKRTDLMCKGDCAKKFTGLMEEYDELEGVEEEQENLYDDLEEEDTGDQKNKNKISDFEKRWGERVRWIPEALDSTYVYYDPHEKENRRASSEKTIKKPTMVSSDSSPSLSLKPQMPPKTASKETNISKNQRLSQSEDEYTDPDELSETDEGQSAESSDEESPGKTFLLPFSDYLLEL